MHKLRDLLGLPVLEIETGTQIGEVQGVVVDLEMASVLVLILSGAHWFADSQGILIQDVFNLGRDAVTVRNREAVKSYEPIVTSSCTYELKYLLDKPVFTEGGLNVGVLADVIYEAGTGEIKGYEISDGIITDFLHGRMIMPLPHAQVVGEDKLIIPEAMAKLLSAELEA